MPVSKIKSKWSGGDLYFLNSAGLEICHLDSANRALVIPSGSTLNASGALQSSDAGVYNVRVRASAAEVNAGTKEVLPAVAGYAYRIVDMTMIAIGGNAATATSVDIVGTRSAGTVRPYVVAVAALTRSTLVKPNSANVTALADGASHTLLDANTAVLVAKQSGGSNLATATHIDVVLSYTLEAA